MTIVSTSLLSLAFDKSKYFVEECIEYTNGSQCKSDDLDQLNGNDLIVVNRHHKDVGFFMQTINKDTSTVGGDCFLHPRACNLSFVSILKACAIRSVLVADHFFYEQIELHANNSIPAYGLLSLFPNSFELEELPENRFIIRATLDQIKHLDGRFLDRTSFLNLNRNLLTFSVDI